MNAYVVRFKSSVEWLKSKAGRVMEVTNDLGRKMAVARHPTVFASSSIPKRDYIN